MTGAERSLESIQYDLHVTVGRLGGETYVFEVGYWLGLLEPYLDDAFADAEDFDIRTSEWFHQSTFSGALEEGAGDRHEHTAEDLFVWAHEWMADRTRPGN